MMSVVAEGVPADRRPHDPSRDEGGEHEDRRHGHRDDDRHRDGGTGDRARRERASPARGRGAGKIGDHRLELAVGARGERGGQALFELVKADPPLSGSVPKPLGDLVAIRV
jgi:hypothetical protein